MGSPGSYTMSELVERSGFDKRTIAYYVQEKLLPRVGRRGPKTRYSQEFLDRLMFIRRLRDLQDSGRLRPVTLSEIREVIQSLSAEEVGRASTESVSEETLRGFFSERDLDPFDMPLGVEGMALSASRGAPAFGSASMEASSAPPPSDGSARRRGASRSLRIREGGVLDPEAAGLTRYRSNDESNDELEGLLQEVERRALVGGRGRGWLARERLTRVPITEEIVLSVRNIKDEDAHFVEKLARLLRRIGRLG